MPSPIKERMALMPMYKIRFLDLSVHLSLSLDKIDFFCTKSVTLLQHKE